MLILTRRIGESIVIGSGKNKIIITALDVHSNHAKIGITASNDVTIHREEVYRCMHEGEEEK